MSKNNSNPLLNIEVLDEWFNLLGSILGKLVFGDRPNVVVEYKNRDGRTVRTKEIYGRGNSKRVVVRKW
jgi:hypothetical protein